ncbi:hypothetical protein RUM44_008103 [Polyplax serrata]|uniref:Uncharacterized protein n=1 Tax=Polyplax serrata TaxID=468196 RepID=A0ABR1B7P5_POLSC
MSGIDDLTGDNFMDVLDNGVILCQLARVIRERAQRLVEKGLHKGRVPELNGHCFQNAARRSFFSRDNMENFIIFCKELGVHQNLLFESDDLVLHNQPRNVILCLLELSRITTKFNIEPPGLVELEKEIAEEEQRTEELNKSSTLTWQFRPSFNTLSRSTSEGSSMGEPMWAKPLEGSDGVPSDHTEDDWSRESAEDTDAEVDGGLIREVISPMNELDKKVQQTTKIVQKHCCCNNSKCSKLSVKKVGDGKYNIAGRNVFVRLLKGRHMMVRVGGGWDTLEHFLLRHDPCQNGGIHNKSPISNVPGKTKKSFSQPR